MTTAIRRRPADCWTREPPRCFEDLALRRTRRLRGNLPRDVDAAWLDVAHGAGKFFYFLRRARYRPVAGSDTDPEQVRLARLLDLPREAGDALAVLANASQRWHAISPLDLVEHLSRDDAVRFLDLCRARLVPGGLLILRTPCADGPFGAHDRYNDLTHQWAMTPNIAGTVVAMVGSERVAILDERPQPTDAPETVRWLVSSVARAAAAALATRSVWRRRAYGHAPCGWLGIAPRSSVPPRQARHERRVATRDLRLQPAGARPVGVKICGGRAGR